MQIHKQILIPLSKKLRKEMTPWESKLWYHLRANRFYGLKFKRQVLIGEYIVDFCCNEKKLIIELDGGQHNQDVAVIRDKDRDRYFREYGYIVLRFWNNEIDKNLEGVLQIIKDSTSPLPSPGLERG